MKSGFILLIVTLLAYFQAYKHSQKMDAVIRPGDRVRVVSATKANRGLSKVHYTAEVVEWTGSGLLKIKPDGNITTKCVSADNVKKIWEAPRNNG